MSKPTRQFVTNSTPSACICSTRRLTCDFSSLKYGMAGARELLCAREARRSRAHDRDLLTSLARIRLWRDPSLGPCVVDDVFFDGLNRYRIIIDIEDARLFARRGAYAAGEFGKVVGPMETVDRLAPVAAINQIVPIGNYVPERAALVAEGDAAIHTARALLL